MSGTTTNSQSSGPQIESIIQDSQEVLNPTEKSALEKLISAEDGEHTGKNEIKTYLEDVNNKLLTVEGSAEKVNIKTFLDTLATKTANQVLTSFSGTKDKPVWSKSNYRGYKDENIALIQLYLCSIGEAIAIDGILGPDTEGALETYWKQDQDNIPEENATEQLEDQVYTFTLDTSTKRDDATFDGKETTVTVKGDGNLHIKNNTIDTTCQRNADGMYTLTIDGTIYQIAYDQKSSKLTWNKPGDNAWKTKTIQLTKKGGAQESESNAEATDQGSTITLGGKDCIVMKDDATNTYTQIKYGDKTVDITNKKAELKDTDGRTYTFDLTDFNGKTFGDGKVTRSKEYTVDDKKISLTASNKTDGTFAIKSATYNKIDASISGDALTFTETNKKTTTQFKPTRDENKSDYTITLISEVKGPFGEGNNTYSIIKKSDKHYISFGTKPQMELTIDDKSKAMTFVETVGSTTTIYTIDHFDYEKPENLLMRKKINDQEEEVDNLVHANKTYTKYQVYQDYRDQSVKVHLSDGTTPPNIKDVIFSKNTDNIFDPINIYDATIVDSNCINANGFDVALQNTNTTKTSLIDQSVADITLLPPKSSATNYHSTLVGSNNNSYTFTPKPATVYDLSKTDLTEFGGLLSVSGSGTNQTLMFQGYTTTADGAQTLDGKPVILQSNMTTDIKIGNQTYEITLDNTPKITQITQKEATLST